MNRFFRECGKEIIRAQLEADDDIETLRGKLNEDPEEALWMRTFSEHSEVGDDGEELDPEKVFKEAEGVEGA